MIAEGEHPTNWLSTSPSQYTLPQFDFYPPEKEAAEKRRVKRTRKNSDGATGTTTVGHDVWIGGGASIRRGVKIGHGAIIAGNAFVTKDVAPYSVVAGTPAKHMRFRFNYATVRKLLTLRWWRFNINDLAGVPFDDITEALKQIQSMEKAGDISPAERKYKSVCVYTKGFYDLSETTETDPEAFPAPKDDPLGLPMYLDFVKSLTS
ncbi:CatB-related O-acetyltransferase [Shimia sp. MIT1388]|uniref:CatB-related O-acetyltransferase n=1 Tax=Shimia sp. MIT1388 TaxID=3096992 RepID=UPI00399A03F7